VRVNFSLILSEYMVICSNMCVLIYLFTHVLSHFEQKLYLIKIESD